MKQNKKYRCIIFTIGKNSALIHQTIRDSRIRERSQGLIVGIQRNGKQITNPESDFIFEANDAIWLVGNEKRIQILMKELKD